MVCTALMEQHHQPMYFALLDHPIPPGVTNLQRWIEAAWKNGFSFLALRLLCAHAGWIGFDREGADQLDRRLVNSTKWIGTAGMLVLKTSSHA
jgi:hypothetical protein